MKTVYLAGGCFWGVEAYFKLIKGIINTQAGYANGKEQFKDPSYEQVCGGFTGYAEAVKIDYDPKIISLEKILKKFFSIIDPTTLNRQAFDVGEQYRSGIFYTDKDDEKIIYKFINDEQKKHEKRIVTVVEPLKNFYPAEDYHQDYLTKNPQGYCHIDLSKADFD